MANNKKARIIVIKREISKSCRASHREILRWKTARSIQSIMLAFTQLGSSRTHPKATEQTGNDLIEISFQKAIVETCLSDKILVWKSAWFNGLHGADTHSVIRSAKVYQLAAAVNSSCIEQMISFLACCFALVYWSFSMCEYWLALAVIATAVCIQSLHKLHEFIVRAPWCVLWGGNPSSLWGVLWLLLAAFLPQIEGRSPETWFINFINNIFVVLALIDLVDMLG